MLAAVEHEERSAIAQVTGERRLERLPRPLADIKNRGDGLGQQALFQDRTQGHQPHALGVIGGDGGGQPERQPGLTGPTDPCQRDEPGTGKQVSQLLELTRATDEATEFDRQIVQRPPLGAALP